jgi:hypothetical protein
VVKEVYRDAWAHFDPLATSFMKVEDFPDFLYLLNKPLGWDKSFKKDIEKQKEYLENIMLPTYNDNTYINFLDCLEALTLYMIIS